MKKDSPARANLVGGQNIVGMIIEEELTIATLYGLLKVPFNEVIGIKFGQVLSPRNSLRLKEVLAKLEKDGVDSEESKELIEEIKKFGIKVVPSLQRARLKFKDAALKEKLDQILDELEVGEDLYLEEDDRVVSEKFIIKGRIQKEIFRIKSIVGTLEIPRKDIRQISFRELNIKKIWKVEPHHIEGSSALITKVKLKKGQKISLIPSGTMTYEGNSFGPGGLKFWNWNGRKMGCLLWRIGNHEPWRILSQNFEGRASVSGNIQFCVHLHGGSVSGEFQVAFNSKVKD